MSKAERSAKVEWALRGARLNKAWLRIECPFCADDGHRDTKRSMGVSATTGYYSCYRCGTVGRLLEPPNPDLAVMSREEVSEEIATMEPPEGFCRLWEKDSWDSYSLAPARAYLKKRFVSRSMMKDLQIGCCDEGRYAGRVIVPMLSIEGDEWYGFVSRLWVDKPGRNATGMNAMKYLYPPGMQRGRFLWNHPAARQVTATPLLVVEGVFDALPFFPDACATLGKLSEEQELALLNAKRPVVFIPDGDAWQEGWALTAKLRFEGMRAGLVKLPPRVDPDELPPDELRARAQKALDDPL